MHPLHHLEDVYECLEKIHEGGMGQIYKVRHRRLDTIRVIKVMHSELEGQKSFQDRFVQEARLATQLNHPNIAVVHDFDVRDGVAFLNMDYIEGPNLAELIGRGPIELDLALDVAIQALTALNHLHEHDLVHRDVSPDNLILTQDHRNLPLVKLIDLGIAKNLKQESELTQTGMFLGKVRYASPEHFGGPESIESRSDIYSFGVVLYELLTGELPFDGTHGELVAGHVMNPPRPFDETDPAQNIPDTIRAIVMKALEKNPSDRFSTAADFAEALSQVREQPTPRRNKEKRRRAGTTAVIPRTTVSSAVSRSRSESRSESSSHQTDVLLTGAKRLAQLEQYTEARIQLESLLSMSPSNEEAAQLLRRVREAQTAPLLGNASKLIISQSFEEAVQTLNRAHEIDPENASIARMLDDAEVGGAQLRKKQHEENLAELVNRVTALLADGELHAVQACLEQARPELGSSQKFAQLERDLDVEKRRASDLRVAGLLGEVNEALDRRDLPYAEDRLDVVLELRPQSTDALDLRERLREEKKAAVRAEAIAGAATEVRTLIARGDLDQAAARLSTALHNLGRNAALVELEAQIDHERVRAEQEQLVELLERVEQALTASKLDRAEELLEVASRSEPTDPELLERRSELDKRLAQIRERQADRQRVDQLVAQADVHGAEGRHTEAVKLLDEASRLDSTNRELGQVLRAAQEAKSLVQEARKREERVASLLDDASRLEERGDLVEAARSAAEARRLAPTDDSVGRRYQGLADSVEAAEAASNRQRQTESYMAQASELYEAGSLSQASSLLERAVELDSEREGAKDLLGKVRKALEEQEDALAKAGEMVATANELMDRSDFAAAVELLRSARVLDPASRIIPARLKEAERALDKAKRPSRPPARPNVEPEEPGPTGLLGRPARFWLLGGAGLLALAVVIVMSLPTADGPVLQPGEAPGEPTPLPPPAPSGRVELDVYPWATIDEVLDEDGEPVRLDTSVRHTPLVVSLPAGAYTFVLRNPDYPEPLRKRVVVTAQGSQRIRFSFEEVDAASYFEKIKWGE